MRLALYVIRKDGVRWYAYERRAGWVGMAIVGWAGNWEDALCIVCRRYGVRR